MTTPEEMSKYVKSVSEKVAKGKKGLSATEVRLGKKLREVQEEAQAVNEDIGRIRESIRQAQNRLENMTRHHLELVSRASGFAESLISLKFGEELDKEEEKRAAEAKKKAAEEAKSKSNGSKDPSEPKRGKTRTKRASKKIQPAA